MYGERIKAKREEFGLTRKELAIRVMSTPQVIKLWETEQVQPTMSDFIILAEEFETSIDWLVGLVGDDEDEEENCAECDGFLQCKVVPHMHKFIESNDDTAYIHVQIDPDDDDRDAVIYSGNILAVLIAVNILLKSLSKKSNADYYDIVAMMASIYAKSELGELFDGE